MAESWVDDVLAFWFETLTPEDWFTRKDETDEAIREKFLVLHSELKTEPPQAAFDEPPPALAATIVFDQFPRNIFRGKAEAFSTDNLALRIARNAVEKGFDDNLSQQQKQFLYMPFMHSEVLADQEHSVMLFKALGNEDSLKYAVEHRDIVLRFGRFPHRNRVLGRTSTDDEREFLEGHDGYGQ